MVRNMKPWTVLFAVPRPAAVPAAARHLLALLHTPHREHPTHATINMKMIN
jgi:hypothetical protein